MVQCMYYNSEDECCGRDLTYKEICRQLATGYMIPSSLVFIGPDAGKNDNKAWKDQLWADAISMIETMKKEGSL